MLALRFILDRDVINVVAFTLQWKSFFAAREGEKKWMRMWLRLYSKNLMRMGLSCVYKVESGGGGEREREEGGLSR